MGCGKQNCKEETVLHRDTEIWEEDKATKRWNKKGSQDNWDIFSLLQIEWGTERKRKQIYWLPSRYFVIWESSFIIKRFRINIIQSDAHEVFY